MNSLNWQKALYRTLWRWHFYAGLFCIPLVITLSVTGAIYLFKPQVETWLDAPYQNLQLGGRRAEPREQIAAALAALPEAKFHSYQLPRKADDAVVISAFSAGERFLVYVNPFNLNVLNIREYDAQFFQLVRTLHGELLAGNVGSVLVELAACWAIVLILTGLYLWWPRSSTGLAGVLYPRLKLGGRGFWRDVHAVVGVWVSLFALFLLITGLPWALVWGSAFKEVRALTEQSWPVTGAQEMQSWRASTTNTYDLTTDLIQAAQSLAFAPPVELSVSDPETNVWQVASQSQNRPQRATAFISAQAAEVQKLKTFADKPTIDRVIGIGVAAHEGQLFGWLNQLLGLLTACGLILLSVSGCILWYKRKPSEGLGAPPIAPNPPVQRAVFAMVLVCALFLPLLLVSLVAIFLIERGLLMFFPALSRWLGARESSV